MQTRHPTTETKHTNTKHKAHRQRRKVGQMTVYHLGGGGGGPHQGPLGFKQRAVNKPKGHRCTAKNAKRPKRRGAETQERRNTEPQNHRKQRHRETETQRHKRHRQRHKDKETQKTQRHKVTKSPRHAKTKIPKQGSPTNTLHGFLYWVYFLNEISKHVFFQILGSSSH